MKRKNISYINEVDQILKDMPKGDWNWNGSEVVHKRLKDAAQYLADHSYLSTDHCTIMAVLGDEETCKYWMSVAVQNKWCKL